MSSSTDYRNHAEVCLRMVGMAQDERDKPLWATMAQSWLRLAEHAERVNLKLAVEHSAGGNELL
jgi:sugar phosphate isomerase/epimerase